MYSPPMQPTRKFILAFACISFLTISLSGFHLHADIGEHEESAPRACELQRQEGRKTFATGRLHAGDVLCAEAEGLFIAAKPGTFEALQSRRDELERRITGGG